MKYFTKKMWLDSQNPGDHDLIWNKNGKLYLKHLEKLRSKLSSKNYKYFKAEFEHIHDDYILDVYIKSIGKIYTTKLMANDKYFTSKKNQPLEIYILRLCPADDFYVLKYDQIKKYMFDFPSESPLPFGFQKGWYGTVGYSELAYLKNGYFRHEILLSSGGIFLIDFKKFTYKRISEANFKKRCKSENWHKLITF